MINTKVCSLICEVNPPGEYFINSNEILLKQVTHKLIGPLVHRSKGCFMVTSKTWDCKLELIPPYKKNKNVFEFIDKDIVNGFEGFWDAKCARGGVVIKLLYSEDVVKILVNHTYIAGHFSSMHQILKGTPRGIERYAKEAVVNKEIMVHLSASNGIDWLDVFSCEEIIDKINTKARLVGKILTQEFA